MNHNSKKNVRMLWRFNTVTVTYQLHTGMTANEPGLHTGYCVAMSAMTWWKAVAAPRPCLSPHEFIEVWRQLMSMAPSHPSQLYFNPVPVWFHVLCMYTCVRIHKMKWVVDYFMGYCRNRSHLVVRCPLIWTNGGVLGSVSTYYGKESCSWAIGYNLHASSRHQWRHSFSSLPLVQHIYDCMN